MGDRVLQLIFCQAGGLYISQHGKFDKSFVAHKVSGAFITDTGRGSGIYIGGIGTIKGGRSFLVEAGDEDTQDIIAFDDRFRDIVRGTDDGVFLASEIDRLLCIDTGYDAKKKKTQE